MNRYVVFGFTQESKMNNICYWYVLYTSIFSFFSFLLNCFRRTYTSGLWDCCTLMLGIKCFNNNNNNNNNRSVRIRPKMPVLSTKDKISNTTVHRLQ